MVTSSAIFFFLTLLLELKVSLSLKSGHLKKCVGSQLVKWEKL